MTLAISETETSTYHYHLRIIGKEGFKFGGGSGLKALCGNPVGWDTQIPVKSWGVKDHVPAYWCQECKKIAD